MSTNEAKNERRRLWNMLNFGGFVYRDAHYLVADMDVAAEAAAQFVPRPLRLAAPATASVFTARFPHNTFGSVYCEAGVFLHVTHRGRRAIYSPWMIVDDDVALILGRELLGYPKKMGDIELGVEGDRVSGVAGRRGVELIRMEGTLGEPVSAPPPMLGRPHRNIRSTLGLALPKVLAFTPREQPIEVRRAELKVDIGRSERDPLARMGFGAVRAAYLHRVNLAAGGLPLPCGLVSPFSFMKHWLLRSH
jgi:acetoacetate decarboxylase